MNLNCETILNFYTLKRKKFLCQIKVNTNKSQTVENTCRCLSQAQWATFDKNLEKLLTASNKLDENGYIFHLNPLIEVKVQKSKLSLKYIYELFYTFGEFNKSSAVDVTEEDLVLECFIDFRKEVSYSSSVGTQEYEPETDISPNAIINNSLPYEPYTPSKKKLEDYKIKTTKTYDINYLGSNEDAYSPKPLLDERVSAPHFVALVPEYTPAPINGRRKHKENNKLSLRKEIGHEKHSWAKQKSKQYKRVECEYIPESQDVATQSAPPIYIPTPIQEEATAKLCNGDNIRMFRKRSKTIDGFSELLTESDKEKLTTKTVQPIWGGNPKYLWQKNFKKRSMTIDEMPDDFSRMPAYIPSPLDETPLQRDFKTRKLNKSAEQYFAEYLQLNEKSKDVQRSDRKVLMVFANDSTVAATSNCGIMPAAENLTANMCEVPKALTHCKENKPSLATSEGEPSHDNQTKYPQNGNVYSDRVFKATAEKSLSSKKNVNNLQTKSMSDKSQSDVKNSERILETQKKESYIKSELYNRSGKCIQSKRSFDHLSTKDIHKQDGKLENHGTQVLEKCRRSERSPNKPKRLIEEQLSSSKKRKSSLKNKELFGTDDEDDDDDDVSYKNISNNNNNNNKMFSLLTCTSASKHSNTSSSSKKKKPKKDRNPEAGREIKLK